MKLQFKTAYNTSPYKGRKSTKPSQTIQGEVYTIRELFERAQIQGHFPMDDRKAPYIDVQDIENINHMYSQGLDITDLAEHKQHLKNLQQSIDEQILIQTSKQSLEETTDKKQSNNPPKSENTVKAEKEGKKDDKE